MTYIFKFFIFLAFIAFTFASPATTTKKPKTVTIKEPEKLCPTCEVEYCPKTSQECAHALVNDECGCCKEGVCLLLEKEKCLNLKLYKNISETEMKKMSVCGDYSECLLRTDIKAGEIADSVCQCQKMEISCGQDNVTYQSMCQLREGKTELKHSGPCKTAPQIITEPEIDSSVEHERFSLNCEAKGFPVPNLYWEFEGLNGLFKLLPGDDPSIAVHNRGGQEPLTVSSWLMIEALRLSDSGSYICVASSDQGVARSAVKVTVGKTNK